MGSEQPCDAGEAPCRVAAESEGLIHPRFAILQVAVPGKLQTVCTGRLCRPGSQEAFCVVLSSPVGLIVSFCLFWCCARDRTQSLGQMLTLSFTTEAPPGPFCYYDPEKKERTLCS